MTHPWLADRTAKFDASGIRKVFDLAAKMANPINLSIGQPDLTGVWSNSSNTVLTRPGKFKTLVLSDAEEAKARRDSPMAAE